MELPIATGSPTGPRGGTHRYRGSNVTLVSLHILIFGTHFFTLKHSHNGLDWIRRFSFVGLDISFAEYFALILHCRKNMNF